MHIRNLGTLDGTVLAFGGPYSNLAALKAMRRVADTLDIAADRVICIGDVVAYCADAVETVTAIRDWAVAVVAGNCEVQLAACALDCGCGFDTGTVCDLLSAGWYTHANFVCGPRERAWMGQCPDIVTFGHAGRRCTVIHGGLADAARFLWPVSPDGDFIAEIAAIRKALGDVDMVIAGHSGVPFVRDIDGVAWINAGVIGMPPNDGGIATRYVLLHPDGRTEICALNYDPTPTIAAMRAVGLTQGYDRALAHGWWPSEDVLPQVMRRPYDQSRAIG